MDEVVEVKVTCGVYLETSICEKGYAHRVVGEVCGEAEGFTVQIKTRWIPSTDLAVAAFHSAMAALHPDLQEAVLTKLKEAAATCNTPPTDTATTSPTSSESSTPESNKD